MEFDKELKNFKNKICKYCKNDECEHGIVAVRYGNMLQMKCCDFIRKDEQDKSIKEQKEVIKYLKDKRNKYEY